MKKDATRPTVILKSALVLLLFIIDIMPLSHSSSIVECQSDQFDWISLTTSLLFSIITLSSSSIADSPLTIHELRYERMIRLLKMIHRIIKLLKIPKIIDYLSISKVLVFQLRNHTSFKRHLTSMKFHGMRISHPIPSQVEFWYVYRQACICT